jgi:acetyl esterase
MTDEAETVEIDPEIAALLEQARAAGLPDPMTLPIAQGRAQIASGNAAWNVELPALAAVQETTCPGPAGAIRLRHYRAVEAARLPAIVYLHGGGWTFCSLDTHDRLVRLLAIESGAAVVSVDYRLAPEHPFPAPLDDCLAAVRWLRKEGAGFGLETGRMVLAGDSAGANLALACLLRLRDAGAPLPLGAALFYGCYGANLDTASHRRFGDGSYHLSTERMGWFWRNYLGGLSRADPLAEPLHADLAGLPPLFLTAAALDPLADDTRALARRLTDAGVPHALIEYPGVVHGFLQWSLRSTAARLALADAGTEIRRILDGAAVKAWST